MTWFYKLMGEEIGPVSSAELRTLAQRGTITIDTPVRKGTDGTWVPANRVQGLFSDPNAKTQHTPGTAPVIKQSASKPTNNDIRTSKEQKHTAPKKWRPHVALIIAGPVIAASFLLLMGISILTDPAERQKLSIVEAVPYAVLMFIGGTIVVWLAFLATYIYLWPAIEAKHRNHPHYFGILTLNIGLGWSFLGWLGALVWARMIREGGNCWRCNARLNGFPMVCQYCQAELVWEQGHSRAP